MHASLTAETWALIRRDYEHTDIPVADISAAYGISSGTLRDRMRRWNWTRRRAAISSEGPPPVSAPPRIIPLPAPCIEHATPLYLPAPEPPLEDAAPVPATAPDSTPIGPRLQSALARVLPAIEATVAKLTAGTTQPREMERAARTLASLTRTLRELNALAGQHPAPDEDDGPNSLHEFRVQLARKMDAAIALGPTPASDGAQPD